MERIDNTRKIFYTCLEKLTLGIYSMINDSNKKKVISMISLLPTMMICKWSINGRRIDYESYLTELINFSPYFMKLTNRERFVPITQQAHGEADVGTSNYELDFKLLVCPSFVNNKLKSLPKVDYSHLEDGFIGLQDRREVAITQAQANGLFVLFYYKLSSIDDKKIADAVNDKKSDLYSAIKIMKTEKNLLIFLPLVILGGTRSEVTTVVARLRNFFSLRDDVGKDTYITVLSKDDASFFTFYILKYENCDFQIVDEVCSLFVPSFEELYRLTSFTENR